MDVVNPDCVLSLSDPPVIVTPPTNPTTQQGKPLEVECVANGNPAPLVYWVRTDGGPLPASASVSRAERGMVKILTGDFSIECFRMYLVC